MNNSAVCSFCGKQDQPDGQRLCFIGGATDSTFICHRCVANCTAILTNHRANEHCERCRVREEWPLTKRQHAVYAFVSEYIAAAGFAPTLDEIAQHFGFASLATVSEHLGHLERKGRISAAGSTRPARLSCWR